jgi:hypothetical protein
MVRTATSFILLLLSAPVGTETLDVRDGGKVDLGTFECRDINRSTVIQRVCYDPAQRAMIVGVKGNYVRYCELPVATFEAFMTAPSMGQFFHRNIRESRPGGRYACQAQRSDQRPHA